MVYFPSVFPYILFFHESLLFVKLVLSCYILLFLIFFHLFSLPFTSFMLETEPRASDMLTEHSALSSSIYFFLNFEIEFRLALNLWSSCLWLLGIWDCSYTSLVSLQFLWKLPCTCKNLLPICFMTI